MLSKKIDNFLFFFHPFELKKTHFYSRRRKDHLLSLKEVKNAVEIFHPEPILNYSIDLFRAAKVQRLSIACF
jgi:hypothetical protein